jgi:hypothetical protein
VLFHLLIPDPEPGFRFEVTVASAEPVAQALLGRWYALVREKRPVRRDYLRHLVRPFDFDTMSEPSQLHCTSVRQPLPWLWRGVSDAG